MSCTIKNCFICHLKPLFEEAYIHLSKESRKLLDELWVAYETEATDRQMLQYDKYAKKKMEWEFTLHNDERTLKQYPQADKTDIITWDSRNNLPEHEDIENFLQFGKSYKVTIEEQEIVDDSR